VTAQLTVSRSALACLLNHVYPNLDDAGPYGPYGPVIRRFIEQAGPLPDPWWALARPSPQPWRGLAGPFPQPWRGLVGATATIRYTLEQQQLAESIGAGDRAIESAHTTIQRFVDDFCGTPPRLRWPFPWPPPKWWELDDELGPIDVLVAGAQFHRIAEAMPKNPLATDFDAGADKLFDAGLQQLDG
jgi:hypothetical protein